METTTFFLYAFVTVLYLCALYPPSRYHNKKDSPFSYLQPLPLTVLPQPGSPVKRLDHVDYVCSLLCIHTFSGSFLSRFKL